ncbi:hypothetical protein RugamoR64_50640 [Duganella rhizosphaerae]
MATVHNAHDMAVTKRKQLARFNRGVSRFRDTARTSLAILAIRAGATNRWRAQRCISLRPDTHGEKAGKTQKMDHNSGSDGSAYRALPAMSDYPNMPTAARSCR